MADKLYRKCEKFEKSELRPPSQAQVIEWGKKLGLSTPESLKVSDGLQLRHTMGNIYIFLLKQYSNNFCFRQ